MDKTFEFVGYENNLDRAALVFKYKLSIPTETFEFREKLILPDTNFDQVPEELLNKILNSLLLVLGISYWKLYCPQDVVVNVQLAQEEAEFWNSLYMNGLGEFFYRNKIDFREFNLFSSNTESVEPIEFKRKERSLLGVGGGKDSIVSAELLKKNNKEFVAFTLGEHEIQEKIIGLLDVQKISVKRIVDPLLLELNKRDNTYNGHIPISAVYYFVGILLGALYDFKYIVFSNEKSANYGNVEYLEKQINHQWSKSYEFEKMLQDYISSWITPDIIPFSLLRPMNEIKIVELFSHYPNYFSVFSSCNNNFKITEKQEGLWCGECAKCLFIFVALAAFISKGELISIFGKNLFENGRLSDKYQELLGVKNHKPFDCVGTPEEVRLAFYLAFKKGDYSETEIMKMFCGLFKEKFQEIESTKKNLLSLSNTHAIPREFGSVLNSI